MNICKSSEDYLEMMLMLRNNKGYIRSIDIAAGRGVSKPSVSYAVKRLRENGFINMEADGLITLTEEGEAIAQRMYNRHKVITSVLMSMGVPEAVACDDACEIEHVISDESFAAMEKHTKLTGLLHTCCDCSSSDECLMK